MRKIRLILLWIWQLPQHLIALFMRAVIKVEPSTRYIIWTNCGLPSFSLGEYVFMCESDAKGYRHEVGHTFQSRYLGWLWLLVIGIPSALHWVWYKCYGAKHGANYYSFYTEKWADKLGGVYRD